MNDNADIIREVASKEPVTVRPMAVVARSVGVNVFEVFWLVVCAILSTTSVMGSNAPSSLEQALPRWAIYAWYGSLGLGSLIGLYGGLKKRKITPYTDETSLRDGMRFYAAGWGYVGTASLVYGTLLLGLFQTRALASGLMTVAWGAASIWRAAQVVRLLRASGGGTHRV